MGLQTGSWLTKLNRTVFIKVKKAVVRSVLLAWMTAVLVCIVIRTNAYARESSAVAGIGISGDNRAERYLVSTLIDTMQGERISYRDYLDRARELEIEPITRGEHCTVWLCDHGGEYEKGTLRGENGEPDLMSKCETAKAWFHSVYGLDSDYFAGKTSGQVEQELFEKEMASYGDMEGEARVGVWDWCTPELDRNVRLMVGEAIHGSVVLSDTYNGALTSIVKMETGEEYTIAVMRDDSVQTDRTPDGLRDRAEELGMLFRDILVADSEETIRALKEKLRRRCTDCEYLQLEKTIRFHDGNGVVPKVTYKVYCGDSGQRKGPYQVLIATEAVCGAGARTESDKMLIQLSLDEERKIYRHSIRQVDQYREQ